MYCTLKKAISLLLAVSLLALWISALLLTQTPVQAVDTNITTASQLKKIVDGLSSVSSAAEVKAVASQMAHLSDSEKRRVSSATLRSLAEYYNTACGISPSNGRDLINVDHGDETSSRRIDEDDSYACGVSAGWADGKAHRLQIDQDDSSGSVYLKMTLSGLRGPAYVSLDMNGNPFSSSRDYYLKWDGYKISASVSSGSLRFVAPGNGVYRLYRDNDSGSSSHRYYGSDRNKYSYYNNNQSTGSSNLDSFWRPVDANIKNANKGDRVRVNLGAQTTVPFQVLQSLYGRDVTLALYESDGNIISIYGKEMSSPSNNISVSALRRMYGTPEGDIASSSSSASSNQTEQPSFSGSISTPNAGGAPAPVYTAPSASSSAPQQTPPPNTGVSAKDIPLQKEPDLEAEPILNFDALEPQSPQEQTVAYQEPVKMSVPESPSQMRRITTRAGMGSILLFMGLAGLTAALGGGLLTYLILLRHGNHRENPHQ